MWICFAYRAKTRFMYQSDKCIHCGNLTNIYLFIDKKRNIRKYVKYGNSKVNDKDTRAKAMTPSRCLFY